MKFNENNLDKTWNQMGSENMKKRCYDKRKIQILEMEWRYLDKEVWKSDVQLLGMI